MPNTNKFLKSKRQGAQIQSPVRAHYRRIPGTLQRQRIQAITRRAINWGPARPIRRQLIFRLDKIHKIRRKRNPRKQMDEIFKQYSTTIFGPWNARNRRVFVNTYNKLEAVTASAIIDAIMRYVQDETKAGIGHVPQKGGSLRKALSESLFRNNPKKNKFKFPYKMRVGVNVKHASIAEAWTPDKVQVKHQPGQTKSRGRPYFADKGDPKAGYKFWTFFQINIRKKVKQALQDACSRFKLNYNHVKYFIKDRPKFL